MSRRLWLWGLTPWRLEPRLSSRSVTTTRSGKRNTKSSVHGRMLRRLARGQGSCRHHHADAGTHRRLDPVLAGRRLANYLKVMTLEAQTLARACGKNHLHNLEPEDLVALTVEAAAMVETPPS